MLISLFPTEIARKISPKKILTKCVCVYPAVNSTHKSPFFPSLLTLPLRTQTWHAARETNQTGFVMS